MTVSFSRWFGRVQAGGKAEQPRYYPQRELLHRVSLTLVRCPNLEDTLPDLLSQVLLDAGCSSPVWLAWRVTADVHWSLNGTGPQPSPLETARLKYQLDLATRGNRFQLQPEDTLARHEITGLRIPDSEGGLQLWLLAPISLATSGEDRRQLLRDLGQAVHAGLDIRLEHERQLTALRQEVQQNLAASLHDSVAQQLCYLCLQTGRLEQQAAEIQEINKHIPRLRVLSGVEVDIRGDGSLDLPDEQLAQCDWVIASIHNGFQDSVDHLTQRMVSAIENTFVDCIAHPTGRRIRKRPPYELDLDAVFEAAASTGTALDPFSHLTPGTRD